MGKTLLFICSIALSWFFTSCQTTRDLSAVKEPFYSEVHLKFAEWNRDSTCCSARGREIAIASHGEQASRAGLQISRAGGNVVDVAIATAFTLAVEHPHSMGLGGGGFLLLHLVEPKPQDFFIDFRETAPRLATREMYLDEKGNVIPEKSTVGAFAVATPGFVAGLYEVHQRWGKLPWKQVLTPAIDLAKKGFVIYPSLAQALKDASRHFEKDPYLKTIFANAKGEVLGMGDRLIQKDLAQTLEKIARDGKHVFYNGALGKEISKFLKERGGFLDLEDLRSYQVRVREPIRGTFRDFEFVTAPPPSAGGILLSQMLGLLEKYPLEADAVQPHEYVHLLSQVMKRGFADRSRYVGDPDFFHEPFQFLYSQAYLQKIQKQLNRDKNTPSSEYTPGDNYALDRGTSHLSVLDRKGNAVSSTLTINDSFGSELAVPGAGFFLNNEMDDFSSKPGEPNVYGLTGGEANAIQPGKRPVSSMMPTIVFRSGVPILVVGGSGGSRIISSVTQVILNDLVLFPFDLKRAVFAPRMHHQWVPDRLDLEGAFLTKTQEELKSKGHTLGAWPFLAKVQAVELDPSGLLIGVFDPRDHGGAEAY